MNPVFITMVRKVGCVFSMVVVSMLSHADFGSNDHRDDALNFINGSSWMVISPNYMDWCVKSLEALESLPEIQIV